MDKIVNGKTVIVNGGGSCGPGWGNGKACAVQYAREGANVFVVDLNQAAAEETVAIIREGGGMAEAFAADVSDPEQVQVLVSRCQETYGAIDVIHHNVGIAKAGNPVTQSLEDWEKILRVNLTSLFLVCKQVLPIMEQQGKGVITAIGSVAGIRCTKTAMVAYSTSKAGLIQLVQSVAVTYADKGIRANVINLGNMDTPLIYQVYTDGDQEACDKLRKQRDAQSPTGKMGTAWDVAGLSVFLASEAAGYINGASMNLDGGISAMIPA